MARSHGGRPDRARSPRKRRGEERRSGRGRGSDDGRGARTDGTEVLERIQHRGICAVPIRSKRREKMKSPQSLRAWLSLALLFVVVAVPAYADPTSDLFALFNQANGAAASNGLNMGERVSLVTKIIASIAS